MKIDQAEGVGQVETIETHWVLVELKMVVEKRGEHFGQKVPNFMVSFGLLTNVDMVVAHCHPSHLLQPADQRLKPIRNFVFLFFREFSCCFRNWNIVGLQMICMRN